jgi:DNA-binding transcriptional ArsR family regulator
LQLYGEQVPETFQLTDERALAALAHPLRMRLLALLRADGPATATGLARRVDESSGVTSYHLRKLADVGLVEEDHDRGTRRERWWRALHEITRWTPADFLGSPAARQATVSWRREGYRLQSRLFEQWLVEEPNWSRDWVEAAGGDDVLLVMTAESLRAMTKEILAVVRRYRKNRAPDGPDTARVLWIQHRIPIRGEVQL